MFGKENISNEFYGNLVQDFTVEQIQQLAKVANSLNSNDKSDAFIKVVGLFVHNSSIGSTFTKPWIWIAEQPITLHLIDNFSHTLHHHLFQNVNLPTDSTTTSHLRARLNSITISLSKIDVLCVSFNLNLMSVSKIISSLNFLFRSFFT